MPSTLLLIHVCTLLAQASSSQDVSCRTLMISLISALIFSKVKLRFFKASSTPWLPDVLVVTKILIPEEKVSGGGVREEDSEPGDVFLAVAKVKGHLK